MQLEECFEGWGWGLAFSKHQTISQYTQLLVKGKGLQCAVGVIFRDDLHGQGAETDVRFYEIDDPFYRVQYDLFILDNAFGGEPGFQSFPIHTSLFENDDGRWLAFQEVGGGFGGDWGQEDQLRLFDRYLVESGEMDGAGDEGGIQLMVEEIGDQASAHGGYEFQFYIGIGGREPADEIGAFEGHGRFDTTDL